MKTHQLLIATNNPGKVRELIDLLSKLPLELVSLPEFSQITEVEETGTTFAENAALKAVGYAQQTGHLALADDSGLEIDILDGRPGVLSARYGGEHTSFQDKIGLLLAEMREKGDAGVRSARFVCSMAVADPGGKVLFATESVCEGVIASEPSGSHGFGYDPIFIPNGHDATFGELDNATKQVIGHRGKALRQIIPFLRDFTTI